ncbi:ribosomal RNA small subunit methyltransferase E [Gemmatimonadetes bacterium T265]|nr:ribosomal RNA small subunit methyltransferase E [Gemmatimonadetes bacterium T265]
MTWDGAGDVRPTVASFVASGPIAAGRIALGDAAAHHARVRRLADGDRVTVRDGAGSVGQGRVARLAKHTLDIEVEHVDQVAAPAPVHLLAPVGDRERMLWLAEKAVEVGVTSWRAVRWQRSRSVSPRGEGDAFVAKLRARMAQALAQSEGAWLPTVDDAAELDDVVERLPSGVRVLLDGAGGPFATTADASVRDGLCLAVGPEGGLEAKEIARCEAAGFRRASLPGNVLRFETAGVVGLAFARHAVERARD